MKSIHSFLVFFILLFNSCHSLVGDEFPDLTKTPVINSILQTDSIFRVHLSLTAAMNDSTPLVVRNAKVIIECTIDSPDTLTYYNEGWYQSLRKVKAGTTYSCKIEIQGFPQISAQTYVPFPDPIDNVIYTAVASKGQESESISSVQFTLKNDTTQKQFWEIKLCKIGMFHDYDFDKQKWIDYFGKKYEQMYMVAGQDNVLLNEASPLNIFSNAKIKSDSYDVVFYYGENYVHFSPKDSAYIELRCIDQSYYSYQKQLYLYQTAFYGGIGNPPQTYPLYSNIKNGLGIFTSYTSVLKKINIE